MNNVFPRIVKDAVAKYDGHVLTGAWKDPKYPLIVKATNFLPETARAAQRFWHVRNQTKSIPECLVCGEPVKWKSTEYATYCSRKCSANSKETQKKKVRTVQDRFGVDNVSQSKMVHAKKVQSYLDTLGVSSPLKSDKVKDKVKKTVRDRYGTDNVSKSADVRQKRSETFKERYGETSIFRVNEFKERLREIHMERRGVPNPGMDPEIIKKIADTHSERYGKHYKQRHIPPESLQKLEDVEWLRHQHHTERKTFEEIGEELGVVHSTVAQRMQHIGIEGKRFSRSRSERELVAYLKSIIPEDSITINDRTCIPPYELDIVIPNKNVAVEMNGLYWHSESQEPNHNYHKNKFELCRSANIRLVQIWGSEWSSKQNTVKAKLAVILGHTKQINVRRTKLVRVGATAERTFLDRNHIHGYAPSTIAYGLVCQGKLVSLMTFKQSNSEKDTNHKILRLCTRRNVLVSDGAATLFKHFTNKNAGRILARCDLRWETGSTYEELGFTLSHISGPKPWYFNNPRELHPQSKFNKSLLHDTLHTFDPEITMYQNMLANGWDRVWDCGNAVYQYEC